MGDFNFENFQQIFEYLKEKLASGGDLTPEERKIYDLLIGFAGQGLNLTNTADFNSLYKAFNALADSDTKKQFEQLYGTGLFQDPKTGAIQFTRPGSVIEQFMRRGLSVKDGPVVAALSEGLRNYMDTVAKNSFAAMTNAYSAMTPIRQQNLQALIGGGNLAQGATNRLAGVAGGAITGARAGGGEGGGLGEPVTIDTKGAGRASSPGFMDKFGPALLGLLGTAIVGGLGSGWLRQMFNQSPNNFSQDQLDQAARDIVGRNPFPSQDLTQSSSTPLVADQSKFDMGFGITPQTWNQNPYQDMSMQDILQQPLFQQAWGGDQTQALSPWTNQPDFVDMGNSGYQNSWQSQPQVSWDGSDSGADVWSGGDQSTVWDQPFYDSSSWSGDESGGYWV